MSGDLLFDNISLFHIFTVYVVSLQLHFSVRCVQHDMMVILYVAMGRLSSKQSDTQGSRDVSAHAVQSSWQI